MDILLLIAGLSMLLAALAVIALLVKQLQIARVNEVAANERFSAKQSEIELIYQSQSRLSGENSSLLSEVQTNREELASVKTSLDLERTQFEEKLALLNESKEQLGEAFKNIANEIFEDKSKKFTSTNKESLNAVLAPLNEKIQRFEKKVEETYDKESKERYSLAKEIENLQKLNTRISEEAVNLTNALKGDNKAQGSWGEFVLESILEKSGLVRGREYEVQVSLKDDQGSNSQPDVIVHLPESRDLIIDSKVSLKAWDAYCSAQEEQIKAEALKQHLTSIRSHIKLLSAKDYQNLIGINSLDYVFLFMPIEAAYSVAIQQEPELFQFAFEKNIIFVVPTTLLTTLKTVQNLWRLAQQNKNANEIAEKAGALYDKFVAFVEDLDEVGSKIDSSKKSFEKAQNKLLSGRGNLIKRAEALRELGAKTSKKQKTELLAKVGGDDTEALLDKKADLEQSKKTRH
ncbi:MAG: DNA recombination protein RmuC [Gammaproteobacteria bacterium]|jgi:DNA recombination protein RmuC|nr:DNA recombination protein RmuC [Gammaproteobacteria bacterium]